MSWVFVRPSDVWFFRDGRPYNAGQGQTAGTLFPPTPLTVQGAFRSLHLGHSNVGWQAFRQRAPEAEAVGAKIGFPPQKQGDRWVADELGQFAMRGPLVARRDGATGTAEWLAPLPLDAYFTMADTWQVLQPARRGQLPQGWTEWPAVDLAPLLPAGTPAEDEPDQPGWLSPDALSRYLAEKPFRPVDDPLFVVEGRLSIGLDYDRKRPREGLIYQPQFRRPANRTLAQGEPGLLVQLEDAVDPPERSGLLALGGEARAAHYRILSAEQAPPPIPTVPEATRLKLLLLTPAWFGDGWRPAGGDWSRFFGGRADVTLVAAAVGRPVHIGGWDVANRRHKPMRACVPAGSVYYFAADNPITPPETFTDTPDDRLSFPRQGFGVVAAGTWTWLENEQPEGG